MAKLTKTIVDRAATRGRDEFIWDEEVQGFGLRVFASGKRSYLIQYRVGGRTRRYTIGAHGVWTAETARKQAKILLGRVAQGEDPAEAKKLDAKAMTMKELCALYLADAKKGLVFGKSGGPKKPLTIATDEGRIRRHIIPLLGTKRVKSIISADVNRFLRDVAAGKTASDVKTKKRGRAIVRGGPGAASRSVGLLGGIFTYAIEQGIVDANPARGIRKPKDKIKTRRLSEAEYGLLGRILTEKEADESTTLAAGIIRALALTGCRRNEIVELEWAEVDDERSCLALEDSKEGASIRPAGLRALDAINRNRPEKPAGLVFPGGSPTTIYHAFPKKWKAIFHGTELADITPHVLRHSFCELGQRSWLHRGDCWGNARPFGRFSNQPLCPCCRHGFGTRRRYRVGLHRCAHGRSRVQTSTFRA
jgi:integrase